MYPQHRMKPTFPLCGLYPDRYYIKATNQGKRRLSCVGKRETMSCVVAIMRQRPPFQQLPFCCGSLIMLLYVFYEFI